MIKNTVLPKNVRKEIIVRVCIDMRTVHDVDIAFWSSGII